MRLVRWIGNERREVVVERERRGVRRVLLAVRAHVARTQVARRVVLGHALQLQLQADELGPVAVVIVRAEEGLSALPAIGQQRLLDPRDRRVAVHAVGDHPLQPAVGAD